ncbi:hypothetical protein QBZ16_000701 [Prototheca wickerhamii]|uniref:Uncharacterized protein n=1 Tax=Prototheca wickerhamii TaxID=3111 RepID=A0AAD9IQ38_PROWI|nr:hypothetical protein QBZ16_000701 [Prototheca wickerhamii]
MRRRPGIQGLERSRATKEHFRTLGDHVNETKQEVMRAQMGSFKQSLEEFALKYKADIRKQPEFRAQFYAMCVSIGVDPLASNKGIWNKLLGLGDFYYELGVQCVESCMILRNSVGPLMEVQVLRHHVQARAS